MTDGNFGHILNEHLESPGDPYFGWISKIEGWEKRRQMFGMFLSNACYFAQFVFAMSLAARALGSKSTLSILLGVEFCAVCVYKGFKSEPVGFSVFSRPSILNSNIAPFLTSVFFYLLVCAVPILIASNPTELGPEVFAGILVC